MCEIALTHPVPSNDGLHDRNVLVGLESGAQLGLLIPQPHHRSHEVTDLRKRTLLSEHVHVLRARTELEGDVARGVLEHDALVPAHLGAKHFDAAELTGCAAEFVAVEHVLHAVEVHLVLKRDAHFVEHATDADNVVIFVDHATRHQSTVQREIQVHAGFLLQFLEALIRRAVDRHVNRAIFELAEPASGHIIVFRIDVPRLDSDPDEILHLVPDRIRVTLLIVREGDSSRPEHRPAVNLAVGLPLLLVVPRPIQTVRDLPADVDGKQVFAAPHDLILAVALELEDAR